MRLTLAALLLLTALCGVAAAQGRRVAMVVGNGAYRNVPALPNAGSDARLIADTLREQGFELVGGQVLLDLDRAKLGAAVQEFGRSLAGAEIGLFYYAGHGLQVRGVNWLVPIDANPARPQDLDFQMVDADLVLRQMEGAGTRLNLLLLDACRNNPFAGNGMRSTGAGLAEMRAPEGTLISYATQPGAVATDGPVGGNGPYAAALATAMRAPETDIFRMFNQVGLQVKRSTAGAQQPWVSNSPIEGDLRFGRTALAGVVRPPTPGPTPGPAPAPTPPPPTSDPLRSALAATRCSLLDLRDEDGSLRVTGFAPPGLDLAALLRQAGGTRGIRVVQGDVRALPAFACPVVELLAPLVRPTRAAARASPLQQAVPADRPLLIALASTGALRVDVYQDDTVRHIQTRVVNGHVSIPPEALSSPGPRLVTAISSPAPLPLSARPGLEPAGPYLEALREALAGAGPVEASIMLLDVQPPTSRPAASRPATLKPPATATAPQGRCAAVLERAQLGEALSEADRTTLRGCR